MIALLNNYSELLNKLDINEKSEIINKAIEDIKEEAIMYEEKYSSTISIFKILLDLKNDDTNNKFLFRSKDDVIFNNIYESWRKTTTVFLEFVRQN